MRKSIRSAIGLLGAILPFGKRKDFIGSSATPIPNPKQFHHPVASRGGGGGGLGKMQNQRCRLRGFGTRARMRETYAGRNKNLYRREVLRLKRDDLRERQKLQSTLFGKFDPSLNDRISALEKEIERCGAQ